MVMDKIYQNNLNKLTDAVMEAVDQYIKANQDGFDSMFRDLLAQTGDEKEAYRKIGEYITIYFVIPLTDKLKGVI